MAAIFLRIETVVEVLGIGADTTFVYLDADKVKKTKRATKEQFLQYLDSLPYGTLVKLSWQKQDNDAPCKAPDLYEGRVETEGCIKQLTNEHPDPKWGSYEFYGNQYFSDGNGNLVTSFTFYNKLEKEANNKYCQDGTRTSYFNHEFQYNPDIEVVYGDGGIVGACCPVGTIFNGGESCVSNTNFDRTKPQIADYHCKSVKGLNWKFDVENWNLESSDKIDLTSTTEFCIRDRSALTGFGNYFNTNDNDSNDNLAYQYIDSINQLPYDYIDSVRDPT